MIQFGGEEVRIELLGGTFMEDPPPGKRRAIVVVFRRHVATIWKA